MRIGRLALATLVVPLAASTLSVPTASGQAASASQPIPSSTWNHPGPGALDAVGAFIYVAPTAPPGPNQVSKESYEYVLQTLFSNGSMGFIGLATDSAGPFVGMQLAPDPPGPPVKLHYPWVPGRAYFLLFYHVGGTTWSGWVLDYNADVWTLVGQVTAPQGSGLLQPRSATVVEPTDSIPLTDCAAYPRIEAYLLPVGFGGGQTAWGSLEGHHVESGDCPVQATIEQGWGHYTLGSEPPI